MGVGGHVRLPYALVLGCLQHTEQMGVVFLPFRLSLESLSHGEAEVEWEIQVPL